MPGRDRTGPPGGGGTGQVRDIVRGNVGQRRMRGNRSGADPRGECLCPNCGARISHQAGHPCYNLSYPECEAKMVRG